MPAHIGPELIAMLPRLRRFAMHLTRSRHAADDLVQSSCERALVTTADRGEAPFDAWMFKITRNLWLDGLRRLKTQGVVMDIEEHTEIAGIDGSVAMERKLMVEQVRMAIDRLPDDQREVLLLVCVEELSYKDAARTLGIPIGTVMSRLARGRVKLAGSLGLTEPERTP